MSDDVRARVMLQAQLARVMELNRNDVVLCVDPSWKADETVVHVIEKMIEDGKAVWSDGPLISPASDAINVTGKMVESDHKNRRARRRYNRK